MKRVLLDENLPRQLKSQFSDKIDVSTVPELGWQAKRNGELLAAMTAAGFTHLLTADRHLRFQQNLSLSGVKIVVLLTHDTRRKGLEPLVPEIESEILGWDESTSNVLEIDLRR